MAAKNEKGQSRFATVHRVASGHALAKDASFASVPGLENAALVRDPYGAANVLVSTWESRAAFEAGFDELRAAFGEGLTLQESGPVESLTAGPRLWRKAWKALGLTSSKFLAFLLGCASIIATCNSIRDSYGAFLAKPEAIFHDPKQLALAEPSSPAHELLAGQSIPVAFTATNVGMSRGSQLIARADRLELVDAPGTLAAAEWDPQTTAHLPLGTGAAHAFRALVRAAQIDLEAPRVCRIRASAEIAAGEWRASERISAETTVRVWPALRVQVLGPREEPPNPANSVLWLEVHFGRAADSGVHLRVTIPDAAGFQLLAVRGAAPEAVWPPAERGDRLEWNVPPQPAFRSLEFGLGAKKTSSEDTRPWKELAQMLSVVPIPGNPDPPARDAR